MSSVQENSFNGSKYQMMSGSIKQRIFDFRPNLCLLIAKCERSPMSRFISMIVNFFGEDDGFRHDGRYC